MEFKHLADKRQCLRADSRKAVAASHNLVLRDCLLSEELAEKANLQATAMSVLRGHDDFKNTPFTWHRSRIAWRVKAVNGAEGWASLSHVDVLPGSSDEVVLEAARAAALAGKAAAVAV